MHLDWHWVLWPSIQRPPLGASGNSYCLQVGGHLASQSIKTDEHIIASPHYVYFCQRSGDLLDQGQIIFVNMINTALENATKLYLRHINVFLQLWAHMV